MLVAAAVAFALYRLKFSSTEVHAHRVEMGEVRGEVMGTGTLEARVRTVISPRIQERLAEMLVDQGDPVRQGQLLARLDDAESRQLVAIAEAGLAAAKATVERVKSDEARAEAVLQQARLDHRRAAELLAGEIAAQADFDKTAEALRVAEADLLRAQSAIVEAERQVLAADKTLLYRKEHLAFTEMRSPYDGLVIRRDRDPGGIVVPGASILHVIATNEIWVSAWIDETAMAGLVEGQPARVVFRSQASVHWAGQVARLGREVDRETREFVVDVQVKKLPNHWTIGQRAEVFIESGCKTNVLLMPQKFINWRDGIPGVFVNVGGRARWRVLALGLHGMQNVEVVQGLSLGDSVVRPTQNRTRPLTDGQRIHVQ